MEGGGGVEYIVHKWTILQQNIAFGPPSAFAPSHTATLDPPVGKCVSTSLHNICSVGRGRGLAGEPGGGAVGA